MALRIPWDEQETVLLIDAYLRVKNKELSQQEAVKEISSLLRCRAVHSGIKIDEKFRNENGISMQMKIVGGLVDEKPSGLHSATRMFTEMVALYKTRKPEFDELLIQAKRESVMHVNVQEQFFVWLSARVTSTQLSEFYMVCKDIESFCINKHILIAPLFETTDFEILQYVVNIIQTDKMFQFKYFRQRGKMKKVMEYYLSFLRESSVPQKVEVDSCKEEQVLLADSITKSSTTNKSSNGVVQKEVAVERNSVEYTEELHNNRETMVGAEVAVEENEIGTDSGNEDIVSAEIYENNDTTWDFADDKIDFLITNPTKVTYFGESKVCNGWQSAFAQIISFLQEDYPAIIRGMVGYRFDGVGKVILSGQAGLDRFSQAVELNNGLYLETDCTPDEIVIIVRLLMNKCNMDYDNIEITYEKCQDAAFSVVGENQDYDVEGISGYIEDNGEFSNKGIQDEIIQILDEMNLSYIDNRNNKGCLWIIGDENLSSVFDKFSQYKVLFHYMAHGGRATKGKPAWWTKDIIVTADTSKQEEIEKIIQSNDIEKDTKVVIPSLYKGKSAFESWLISDIGLAETSAQSFTSAIEVAGEYSVSLGYSDKELYSIFDVEQVYQISSKLLANSEFAQLNKNQHNRYGVALSKYWDYCNALSCGTTVSEENKTTSEKKDNVKKIREKRTAFISWAREQNMQQEAILAFLSGIIKCSEFAQLHAYIKEEHFFLIEDLNVLEYIFSEMRKDSRFVELDNERQNRLTSAMNELIVFRRATANTTSICPDSTVQNKPVEKPARHSDAIVAPSTGDSQVIERYMAILKKNFVDGFRPAKSIDRNRFKMYYSDMFGQELTEGDEELIRTLMKVGTLRDGRIFVKDEVEQKDLIEEINDTIMETFKAGASCIYLDCLFAKFQEKLVEMLHIYNVDSLESVLLSSGKQNYFKRYNYLFKYNKEPAPAKDVIEYMKNSHLPVTYSEIGTGLWYIPLDKIKHTLVTTPGIVNVAPEAYLYAQNLPVSEKEIQQIAELISQALLQRSYISDVELMQMIKDNCPSVLINTQDYPMWGLRNALAYLLQERFSFRGAIISNKDEEISMAEVFAEFCQCSQHMTVDELRNFASELNTVIYWDSVYGEMVRVNQNEFVRRDQIHFDVEQTDAVLDSLIQSAYTPIKTINLFLHFPAIDVPWNSFVLESYVANYSKKFRLLHAGYTATDCCGAMVRQESGISDYRTLIVDVLAKNTCWKNKKDALQLLVDLGYQQRRIYSDIEKVMQEAKTCMSASKK